MSVAMRHLAINTGSPLCYPFVALCHGDLEALNLQDWSFHTLQQFIMRLTWQLYYHQIKLSSIVPASSPNTAVSSGQGQLSVFHALGWLTCAFLPLYC